MHKNGGRFKDFKTHLYKTELCRSFQETGTCPYGSHCQFAHGDAELRPVLRHKKFKSTRCKNFWTKGFCPYGARCCFIHDEQDTELDTLRTQGNIVFVDDPNKLNEAAQEGQRKEEVMQTPIPQQVCEEVPMAQQAPPPIGLESYRWLHANAQLYAAQAHLNAVLAAQATVQAATPTPGAPAPTDWGVMTGMMPPMFMGQSPTSKIGEQYNMPMPMFPGFSQNPHLMPLSPPASPNFYSPQPPHIVMAPVSPIIPAQPLSPAQHHQSTSGIPIPLPTIHSSVSSNGSDTSRTSRKRKRHVAIPSPVAGTHNSRQAPLTPPSSKPAIKTFRMDFLHRHPSHFSSPPLLCQTGPALPPLERSSSGELKKADTAPESPLTRKMRLHEDITAEISEFLTSDDSANGVSQPNSIYGGSSSSNDMEVQHLASRFAREPEARPLEL